MKFKFTPSPIFKDDAKKKFMAAFETRYPSPRTAWLLPAGRMIGAAAAVLAIVASGATVYADTANVRADSPLYPLKRLGENVQLAVAPPAAHASLEAAFAARRVAEIDDLQGRNPSSTMIAELANDASSSVDASIVAADSANLTDGSLTSLCNNLLGTLVPPSASSSTFSGKLYGDLGTLDRFTYKCEAYGNAANVNNGMAAVSIEATSSVNASGSVAVSSSITVSSGKGGETKGADGHVNGGRNEGRGQGGSFGSGASVHVSQQISTTSENIFEATSSSATESGDWDAPELETRIRDYLNRYRGRPPSSSLDLSTSTPSSTAEGLGAIIGAQGGGLFRGLRHPRQGGGDDGGGDGRQ